MLKPAEWEVHKLADDLYKLCFGDVIMFFGPVEKNDPVEMIQFVLEDPGYETFHIGFHLMAVEGGVAYA